jgi:predicted nucleic acid-binding protein
MAAGCFLDTNILLYAISTTTSEQAKRSLARYLLQDDDWTLSIQVLQEFYVQATRTSRPNCLLPSEAVELFRCWRRFTVQPINETVLDQALELHSNHPLSYWDAAIIAAAHTSDCTIVLSEDMGDGQIYGGVTVRNPFAVLS